MMSKLGYDGGCYSAIVWEGTDYTLDYMWNPGKEALLPTAQVAMRLDEGAPSITHGLVHSRAHATARGSYHRRRIAPLGALASACSSGLPLLLCLSPPGSAPSVLVRRWKRHVL